MSDLKMRFHNDMVNIYTAAKELGYTPSRFIQSVSEKGGYQAAKDLVYKNEPSDGFTSLWELKRLDLSVEAYVLKPEYNGIFTDEERMICRRRLEEYEYY